MGLGFIGSLMVIATLVVGLMGRAMESEFRVALMAAPMLGSSIVVLSMALVAITSGKNNDVWFMFLLFCCCDCVIVE